ncbi:MAG TPA: MFS transporter [Rhizomicrobium sp.]|jgi:predicted MFS family arabinose efflux permease
MVTTGEIAPNDNVKPERLSLVVAAASAGTAFEWYDFFIFGSLAAIIGKHFYAGASSAQAYILALLTFAVGFAVRPFGALVFGRIGDRVGRKRAFLVTMILMGLATVGVGLLPDATHLGLLAAYTLVALRVIQGFAIGGEYGGAAVYVAEHAPRNRRGTATGWIQVAATLGLLLAIGVILVCRTLTGEDAFRAWGWRLPFLISAALLAISLWIRMRLEESPLFRRMQEEGQTSHAPLAESFLRWPNLKIVLIALFGLLMGQGVVWYTAMFYTQFFLEGVVKLEPAIVNAIMLAVIAASAPLHMIFAWLSDRVGRKPVMLFGLGLAAVSLVPGFQMLAGAANPALVAAAAKAPVIVMAAPADCSVQFDPVGKTKFATSCDIAKSALAGTGVPYRNQASAPGTQATITIGSNHLASPDGTHLDSAQLATAKAQFVAALKSGLRSAGYPLSAPSSTIDVPLVIVLLLVFVTAASALYGPQAAALVELFPTRIRYSALSFPYHVGVGWFGGFLPVTAYAIVVATGDIYAGLWYPTIIAGLGFFVTLFFLPETRARDIEA